MDAFVCSSFIRMMSDYGVRIVVGFGSKCGLCDTYYIAHVKNACAFLGDGMSRIEVSSLPFLLIIVWFVVFELVCNYGRRFPVHNRQFLARGAALDEHLTKRQQYNLITNNDPSKQKFSVAIWYCRVEQYNVCKVSNELVKWSERETSLQRVLFVKSQGWTYGESYSSLPLKVATCPVIFGTDGLHVCDRLLRSISLTPSWA